MKFINNFRFHKYKFIISKKKNVLISFKENTAKEELVLEHVI